MHAFGQRPLSNFSVTLNRQMGIMVENPCAIFHNVNINMPTQCMPRGVNTMQNMNASPFHYSHEIILLTGQGFPSF